MLLSLVRKVAHHFTIVKPKHLETLTGHWQSGWGPTGQAGPHRADAQCVFAQAYFLHTFFLFLK